MISQYHVVPFRLRYGGQVIFPTSSYFSAKSGFTDQAIISPSLREEVRSTVLIEKIELAVILLRSDALGSRSSKRTFSSA